MKLSENLYASALEILMLNSSKSLVKFTTEIFF